MGLLLALLLAQSPVYDPAGPVLSMPSTMSNYAFFEFAPASGAGMGTACACTAVRGAKGEVSSFARASVAECESNDGQRFTQCGNDLPRVSSGTATSSVLGVWKEQAKSNSLTQSRSFEQAAWVKTNMTCTKTATGMRNDANGASTCTATGANATVCQSIVYVASTNTTSGHIKRRTGTGAVTVARDGATYSSDLSSSLSSTLWRRAVPYDAPGCGGGNCLVVPTLTSAIANPQICVKLATSGDAVDLDFWQDEDQATVTQPIETTAAGASRAADVLDFPLVSSPTAAGGGYSLSGTIVTGAQMTAGGTPIPLVVGGGTVGSTSAPSPYVWMYSAVAGGRVAHDTSGVTSAGAATQDPFWTSASELETSFAVFHTGSAIGACQRGVCAATAASTLGTPSFTRILIGRFDSVASRNANGVIKLVKYDPSQRARPDQMTGPVVWVGDSIVYGNGNTPLTPPIRLAALISKGVVNAGVGGNTVSQCGTRWQSTYRDAGYATLVWSCAVNDLAASAVGTTLATAAQVYLAEARARGMKVIITGVTPWKNSAGWTAAKQTETVAYNSAMSTWAGANGALYVPTIASMGGGGADPDVIAVAYESPALDKIHLSVAGALQLATLVQAANP